MKTIKKISILFLSLVAFYACNDEQLNVDNFDGNVVDGGLLDVKNTALNYVVGNPGPYNVNIRVYQGEAKTTSIRVSKTFYSGNFVSNTVDTFKTIAISNTDQNSFVNYSFDFNEMVAGLVDSDGSPLSTNDGDYLVGDYWKFDYFVTNSNGEVLNYTSTKATVSTRFAGTYRVLQGDYWRLGVYYANYFPDEVIIESIDASIYKHNGIAAWPDGNAFYFTVNNDTGAISIMETDPAGNAVLLNDQPIITCDNYGGWMVATCAGSDIAVKNDDTGEDTLTLTVGYNTAGSGPREFYEILEKIVD
jgi:hypothetical protein